MEIRSFTTIFNTMKNWIITKQDKLTDFNNGSVISSLVEAIAREIAQIYIRCRVGYDQFLSAIPYSVFKFYAKQGGYAVGSVVFSRTASALSATQIPAGTIVAADTFFYTTTANGSIASGQIASAPIPVISSKIGFDYNVDSGQISKIISILPSDITSVTNTLKFTGGFDTETDFDFTARFQDYIKGLSHTNIYGIMTAGKKSSYVRSVSLIEHFPPVDDIFNVTVYVDDGTGYTSPEAITDVTNILEGDGSPENPGYKACGINFRVLAPTVVLVDLEFTLYTRNTDEMVAKYDAEKTVREYINNLLIGDDVILSTLVVTLRNTFYIYDVDIASPSGNITIGSSQLARFGSAAITVVSE